MALKAGYRGIKKYIADKLNRMNPGDSFATDAEIAETARQIYGDIGVLGAKNLYKLYAITETKQNITYTPDLEKGTISVSGTPSGSFVAYYTKSNVVLPAGKYIITGVSDAVNIEFNTAYLRMGTTNVRELGSSFGARKVVEILSTDVYDNIQLSFKRASNDVACSGVIKPMIRRADDSDETFQPYAQTNRELTVTKADITALGTQEGATASRLYHPGEHFYKDGKFCTVIGSADVAAESTWTLNTNYVEGTVADNLVKQAAFSATTQSNGNFTLTTDNIVLIAIKGDPTVLFEWYQRSQGGYTVHAKNYDGTDYGSTEVSGSYYYI